MISVLVEPRGSRRSSGVPLALGALMAYAGVASIAAGAASAGAGLAVLAMGLLAATIVDHVLWREMAFGEPEAIEAKPQQIAALPPPQRIDPLPDSAPVRRSKVLVSNAPGAAPSEAGGAA